MGYNTTVVLLNDCLSNIEADKDLGKKLADATREWWGRSARENGHRFVDVSAGNAVNALCVVDTHHANEIVPVLVGGNHGWPVREIYVSSHVKVESMEEDLLRELARKHGYNLTKKRPR